MIPKVVQSEHFTGSETGSGRSFEERIVIDCVFEDYTNEGAMLSNSVFIGCAFKNVDFYWAHLFRTRFLNCEFDVVDLRGADLADAVFVDCRLFRCDFSNDNLGGDTSLTKTLFHESKQTDCRYSTEPPSKRPQKRK